MSDRRRPNGPSAEDGARQVSPHLGRCEKGTALTEFVIVLPVFLITLSGLLALSELVIGMSLVEVRAYKNTMNEVMQVPRFDVAEAEAQGLSEFIRGNDGYAAARDDITTAPPRQMAGNIPHFNSRHDARFQNLATSMYHVLPDTNHRFYAYTGQAAPEIKGLLDVGANTQINLRGQLIPDNFAFAAQIAYRDRNLFAHEPFHQGDFTGPFYDNLFARAQATDLMPGDMVAAMLGHRYGTISADANLTVSREIFVFEYDMDAGSYYVSAVPGFTPNEMGGSGMEMQMRATAYYRTRLEGNPGGGNQIPPYLHLLKVSNPTDIEGPVVAPMAFYAGNDDLNIDAAPSIFGGWLSY